MEYYVAYFARKKEREWVGRPRTSIAAMVGEFFPLLLSILSLPLWLIPRRGRPVRLKSRHEMHPMAYVDGLRGICAIIIMTAHTMDRGWKWIPDRVLAVPWLQFPFRGGYAGLAIFFWISGYTTTYKLCELMQKKRVLQFHDVLASTIFRRYFRLFLPVLPFTLISGILVKSGIAIAYADIYCFT